MTVTISTGEMLAELAVRFPMLREPCDHSNTCPSECLGYIPVKSLEAVWAAARSIGWHPQFYYAQGPAPEDSVNRGFFHSETGSVMSQEREDFAGFVDALYKAVDAGI